MVSAKRGGAKGKEEKYSCRPGDAVCKCRPKQFEKEPLARLAVAFLASWKHAGMLTENLRNRYELLLPQKYPGKSC